MMETSTGSEDVSGFIAEAAAVHDDQATNGNGAGGATIKQEHDDSSSQMDNSANFMANGSQSAEGVIHPYDDLENKDYSADENYQKIVQYGISPLVAAELVEMFNAGIFQSESLEERTLEFVKNIQAEHGRFVLNQFRKSNLMGILNPSAYLGSLIKNYKERVKLVGPQVAQSTPVVYAPSRETMQAVLDNKGYSLEVTIGQRKYGGPPPGFEGNVPSGGCEVYVGKIPKDVYEDELVPLFEQCGDLYDFRLMMDPLSGTSKGYGFATFMKKADATKAAEKFDGYDIRPGKKLRCNVSIANTRLFVGNIPKSKSKEDILEEFQNNAELEGLQDVIVYPSAEDPDRRKNRGFAFLEFTDHKNASTAKRRLSNGRLRPWNCDLVVDWAEPQDEFDEEVMAAVKSVYIRNLKEAVTEENVKEGFSQFGEVEKLKRIKDYCFVHYLNRDDALKAIEAMNGKEFHGSTIEVSLARPQSDRKKNTPRFQRGGGGPGFGGGMMRGGGMRGGYGGGGNMYQMAPDPYAQGYGAYPYDYGGYGAGGYGPPAGGYDYGAAAGYDYSYAAAAFSAAPPRGGMGYGGSPRGRGMSPRGGPRGMPMYGGGAGMGFGGRGASRAPFPRGGSGFGGGRGAGPKGGLPIKRALPTGATNSSPKRKNDGQQDWSNDAF